MAEEVIARGSILGSKWKTEKTEKCLDKFSKTTCGICESWLNYANAIAECIRQCNKCNKWQAEHRPSTMGRRHESWWKNLKYLCNACLTSKDAERSCVCVRVFPCRYVCVYIYVWAYVCLCVCCILLAQYWAAFYRSNQNFMSKPNQKAKKRNSIYRYVAIHICI